jgi:flagellar motility protein MotE (MotC chaperone)
MKKNSYEQFFKKAQDIRRGDTPPARFSMKSKPKSKPKFPTAESALNELSEAQVEAKLRQNLRMRPQKKKTPFPWKALAGLAVTVAGAGFYFAAPDQVTGFLSKVEISAIGGASAAEDKAAEKSKSPNEKQANAAAGAGAGNPDKGPEVKPVAAEDLSHFEKLKQRKEELDMREKELAELEEELQRQKVELDKRIQQLEEMRGQIATVLKDRVEVDQEKVTKLVDLYSNMKPKQAADVIGSINEDLAVEVLAKMKKKNAAEIMNLLDPVKARVLSEKYTGYRRAHGEKS